jgi:ABC-type dipeptide/oligopeptide/nickel transport system ATPase component
LHDISFSIEKGEILGLIGESGSGKSMTAMAALGLLPRGATSTGAISIDGTLNDFAGDFRKSGKVSAVFQNPMTALNPFMRVGKQLGNVLNLRENISRKDQAKRVQSIFSDVRLDAIDGAEKRFPHEFSGGQLQRILIGMALASKPNVLIADEPTTSLDVTTQKVILDLLVDRVKEQETAVLLITHDLGVIADRCDKVAVIRQGRILEAGTTEEVIGNPKEPYTRELLESVPRMPVQIRATGR